MPELLQVGGWTQASSPLKASAVGGLVRPTAAAQVHLHALAEASFGIGIISWMLISSLLLNRLFVRPAAAQLRFIPLYARLRYSPGFWSFTFPYAAGANDALLWLTATRPPGAAAYAALVIAATTALVVAIAARTVLAVARGQLLDPPH